MMRSDAEKWLREMITAKAELDSQWESLRLLSGVESESPFGAAVWRPMEKLIDAVAELIGDQLGSVSWFVWDNDCGRKRLQHSVPGSGMRTIETVDDLLDVLGY